MKAIKITFQDYLHHRITDFNIMDKPTQDIVLEIPIIIEIDDKKLAGLLLKVKDYTDFNLNENEKINTLLKNYKKLFLDRLVSIDSLDIFTVFPLLINKDEMNYLSISDTEKIEIEINENLYSSLQNMIEEFLLLKKEIDTNIAFLRDAAFNLISNGINYEYTKIQKALDFLYECAECSGDIRTLFTVGNISDLSMYFYELSKRKIESNINYQIYLRKIKSIIMHLHPPKTWVKKPY